MKTKIIIILAIIILLPNNVLAKVYTFDFSSKVNFEVDNSWFEEELSKERDLIIKKWTSLSCGTLMFLESDLYSEITDIEVARSSIDSYYLDDNLINDYVEGVKMGANVVFWNTIDYNLKYIYIEGYENKTSLPFISYSGLNNGYLIGFQYYGEMNLNCKSKVVDVVKSVRTSIDISDDYNENQIIQNENNEQKGIFTIKYGNVSYILSIIVALSITIFSYMSIPIILLIINKKKFELEKAKKIALWNSIIVALIFIIINLSMDNKVNLVPPFIYYYINIALLSKKTKKSFKKSDK